MIIDLTADEIYTLLSWRNPDDYKRLMSGDTPGDEAIYTKLKEIYDHGSDNKAIDREYIAFECQKVEIRKLLGLEERPDRPPNIPIKPGIGNWDSWMTTAWNYIKHMDQAARDVISVVDNMKEGEALRQPPTNYGTCGCHSVPGDSKTCKVHTDRDYYFFLQGLEAGKETMMEPSDEEPDKEVE